MMPDSILRPRIAQRRDSRLQCELCGSFYSFLGRLENGAWACYVCCERAEESHPFLSGRNIARSSGAWISVRVTRIKQVDRPVAEWPKTGPKHYGPAPEPYKASANLLNHGSGKSLFILDKLLTSGTVTVPPGNATGCFDLRNRGMAIPVEVTVWPMGDQHRRRMTSGGDRGYAHTRV